MQAVLTSYPLSVVITVAGAPLGPAAKFHWTELSPQREIWRRTRVRQRVTSLSDEVCYLYNNRGETPQHNC